MGLFEKLRSLLGFEKSEETSQSDRRDVGITVEREGDERRRTGESETSPAGGETEAAEGAGPSGSASAAAATGGVSSGETATTTGSGPDPGSRSGPETATTEAEPTPDPDADADRRVPSEAVDVVKGIGPTYAGRLSEAGVETVEDLAAADPEEVAKRADVPRARLEDWIERANERSR